MSKGYPELDTLFDIGSVRLLTRAAPYMPRFSVREGESYEKLFAISSAALLAALLLTFQGITPARSKAASQGSLAAAVVVGQASKPWRRMITRDSNPSSTARA